MKSKFSPGCCIKMISKLFVSLTLFSIPQIAVAQINTLSDIVVEVGNLIDLLLPVVVGLAILGFFWGLTQYIYKAGDKEAQEEGRRIMIAGVIGLFLISAVGGIVEIIAESLDITTGESVPAPSVATSTS